MSRVTHPGGEVLFGHTEKVIMEKSVVLKEFETFRHKRGWPNHG